MKNTIWLGHLLENGRSLINFPKFSVFLSIFYPFLSQICMLHFARQSYVSSQFSLQILRVSGQTHSSPRIPSRHLQRCLSAHTSVPLTFSPSSCQHTYHILVLYFFFTKQSCIEIQLIYNTILVPGVKHNGLTIIHVTNTLGIVTSLV